MRKSVTVLLVLALLAALGAAPATAGKAKKKKGSFTVEALPYPGPSGCLESQEGVNKHSEPFKTPWNGVMTLSIANFQGDWDLFLTDSSGTELMSDTSSQLTGDPPTEEITIALPKGMEVLMVPCNWAGDLSADASWEFVATK